MRVRGTWIACATALGALALPTAAPALPKYFECQKPVRTGVEVYGLHNIGKSRACPPALELFAWENARASHARALYGCRRPKPGEAGLPYLKLHRFRGWSLSRRGIQGIHDVAPERVPSMSEAPTSRSTAPERSRSIRRRPLWLVCTLSIAALALLAGAGRRRRPGAPSAAGVHFACSKPTSAKIPATSRPEPQHPLPLDTPFTERDVRAVSSRRGFVLKPRARPSRVKAHLRHVGETLR